MATNLEKHKKMCETIGIIKDYFNLDEMGSFYLYFNYYKSKLYPEKMCGVFVENNNLCCRFSYKDNQITRELCCSDNKEIMRQITTMCHINSGSGTLGSWWYEYNIYLSNCKSFEQEEMIKGLRISLETLQIQFNEFKNDINKKVISLETSQNQFGKPFDELRDNIDKNTMKAQK